MAQKEKTESDLLNKEKTKPRKGSAAKYQQFKRLKNNKSFENNDEKEKINLKKHNVKNKKQKFKAKKPVSLKKKKQELENSYSSAKNEDEKEIPDKGVKRKRDDNVKSPNKKKGKFDIKQKAKTGKFMKKGKMVYKGKHKKLDGIEKKQDEKKNKLCEMKKKERKVFRKQKENKFYEITKQMKIIWEVLRRKDCKQDKKDKLLDDIFKIVKGNVTKLMYSHDTVLILECILSLGTEDIRTALFEEFKEFVIPLSKSKYGKYFLMSMLTHGTKEEKKYIAKAFHGKIVDLMKHTEAAEVIEAIYRRCENAQEKSELIQEFYGVKYKFFKQSESLSLMEIFEEEPEEKQSTLNYVKEVLLKLFNKSVLRHSIIHHVLWQFMQHCDEESRTEMIQCVRDVVPEILHTKDGSKAAMHCIWHGTSKDRKVIVKGLKPYASKAAMEEHGHTVLIALFDCVDDTRLIEKNIVRVLIKSIVELSENQYGMKVLIFLLNPRDSHYFHGTFIEELKAGYSTITSKKEPSIRQAELKEMVEQPLMDMLKTQLKLKYTDNSFCYFALTILKHIQGVDKSVIFETVVETIKTSTKKFINFSGIYRIVNMLIKEDVNRKEDEQVLFCEFLLDHVHEDELQSWTDSNRGCFLLVGLFESGIPSVIERVQIEMEDQIGFLPARPFVGAKILLEKLK